MFNGRLPWFSRKHAGDVQTGAAVYGDHGVRFNDDGRPLYPGQNVRPTRGNLLFWRRDGVSDYTSQPRVERYRPYTRTIMPAVQSTQQQQLRSSPFITRRFDAPARTYQTTNTVTTMRPEIIVIEEMKIYDEKPCACWLFLVLAVVMFMLGILNVLWCWQYHWFSRFWCSVLLFVFGICGLLHRGDYVEIKLRSAAYIVLGLLTTLAVTAACAAVLSTLAHQLIEISQFGYPLYVSIQEFRYEYAQYSPLSNLTNWDYNIAVCLGLDCVQLLLVVVAFTVLASTLHIIDRYFNSHYVIRRKVEPFCEPWLFNPWGQCNLGQAQIFIGLVLLNSVHGTFQYPWQKTGAAVWAGIIPIFAGIAAALCLKGCDPKRRLLNIVAIVLEVLSILGSIVAIVLVTLGIIDNITTLRQTDNVMILSDWPIQMMVASSALFAVSDMTCIVNVFYSLSLLFRIFFCVCNNCCGRDWTRQEPRIIDDQPSEIDLEDELKTTTTTTTYDQRELQQQQPSSRQQRRVGRFDPFRPADTHHTFYVQ